MAPFAATYPERTRALVRAHAFAKPIRSPDYPWAPTPEQRENECEYLEREWGNLMDIAHYAPSKVRAFATRLATYFRNAASPGAAVAGGETLVSSMAKDPVAGAGLTFSDRGAHALKGVPGVWRLFAAA